MFARATGRTQLLYTRRRQDNEAQLRQDRWDKARQSGEDVDRKDGNQDRKTGVTGKQTKKRKNNNSGPSTLI